MLRPILTALLLALPGLAQALCTSDGVPQPRAVLERFTRADCLDCWRDPATPAPGPDAIALDWIVPGGPGADAPMAAVALDEALERLRWLKRAATARSDSVLGTRTGSPAPLRAAQSPAFNDYIAASIALQERMPGPWHAWLLLVEQVPAGTEGSPVPRNVVRNVFRPDWDGPGARRPRRLEETRSMQIHEGARADRLRLVAILQDGRGHIRAITQTECRE